MLSKPFSFLKILESYMKFCFNQFSGSRVLRGTTFEIVDERTTDESCLYYKLPGSGKLKS